MFSAIFLKNINLHLVYSISVNVLLLLLLLLLLGFKDLPRYNRATARGYNKETNKQINITTFCSFLIFLNIV